MRPVLNQRREEPKRIRSHPQWRQTAWLIPLISVRLPPTAECRPFSQARALAFSGGAELGMLENETSDMADILSTGLAWMLSGRAVLPAYFTAETCAVIFRQPANANRAPRSAAAAGRAWGHDPVQPLLPTRRHCRAADRWETGGADQCAIASRHRVAAGDILRSALRRRNAGQSRFASRGRPKRCGSRPGPIAGRLRTATVSVVRRRHGLSAARDQIDRMRSR